MLIEYPMEAGYFVDRVPYGGWLFCRLSTLWRLVILSIEYFMEAGYFVDRVLYGGWLFC